MVRTSIVLLGLCMLSACSGEDAQPQTKETARDLTPPPETQPLPKPKPDPQPEPQLKPEPTVYYDLGVHYYPGWWVGQKAPTDKHLPWGKHWPWLELVRYHTNVGDTTNWAQQWNDYRRPLQSYIAPNDKTVYTVDNPLNSYYYDSGSSDVMATQIKTMHEYGINFVVFNWFWNFDRLERPDPDDKTKTYRKFGTYLDQAVKAYQNLSSGRKPRGFRYAVAWDLMADDQYQAQPTKERPWSNTPADWFTIVDHWVNNYFKDPDYLTLPSPLDPTKRQPVMYILNPEEFDAMVYAMGYASAKKLIDETNAYVSDLTVKLPDGRVVKPAANGIQFVVHHRPVPDDLSNRHWTDWSADAGFAGFSAYNYPNGYYDEKTKPLNYGQSSSYYDLDRGYRQNWSYLLRVLHNTAGHGPGTTQPRKTQMKFHVPMTSGWNSAPWRKDADDKPTYDPVLPRDLSTPKDIEEFKAHLRAGRDTIRQNRKKSDKVSDGPTSDNIGIICCWNEFGEGSFIEPTEARGYSYLKAVQEVFVLEPEKDAGLR